MLFTSCQKPPDYESRYTAPSPASSVSTSVSATPLGPPTASFVDTFDQPDTALGLGKDWDMRGRYIRSYPLPPATDGFIKDGHYTYAGNSIVYAVRKFGGTVRRIGAFGRWDRIRPGSETSFSLGLTPSDDLINNVVHLGANRETWKMTVRRNFGAFQTVAEGKFSPPLQLDRNYQFEFEIDGDSSVTVRVPGAEVTRSITMSGLFGNYAFWGEFVRPEELSAGIVFNFDTVWATEDGQPVAPVAGLAHS